MTRPAAPPDDAIEWISKRFYESLTADQRAEIEESAAFFTGWSINTVMGGVSIGW